MSLAVSDTMCISALDIKSIETLVEAQVTQTHTLLFCSFSNGYGKFGFTTKLVPMVEKQRWQLRVERYGGNLSGISLLCKHMSAIYLCCFFTDLDSMFVEASTKEEWGRKGDYFFEHKLWLVAVKCYRRAGDGESRIIIIGFTP